MFFISIVPVAPMRLEPSHKSEMVSQLIFGELCQVLESSKDFHRIKCVYDGYEGWCQKSQLAELVAGQNWQIAGFVKDWSGKLMINEDEITVPFGSALPSIKSATTTKAGLFNIRSLVGSIHLQKQNNDRGKLLREFAWQYLGTPYLWGGKSVFGADCSGFTQQVYKMIGVWLPRDSSEQALMGEEVSFLQEAQLGDLAFFDNEEGRIVHVGIMLNSNEIIHASGNVHIDNIDSAGIINRVTGVRTHKLRIINRLF